MHHHFDPQATESYHTKRNQLIGAALEILDLDRRPIDTLKALQTLIILLFAGLETAQSHSLFDIAIRSAQTMGLHRLGDAPLEKEDAVRVWWLLVARSWITATQTGTYAVHASQFNTRRWVVLPSERQQIHKDEPPGWTTTSYLQGMLMLADVTRQSVDLLNSVAPTSSPSDSNSTRAIVEYETRAMLARTFVEAATNLPPFYSFAQSPKANRWRLGDKPRHLEERCVLQQYVFCSVSRLHVYEMCSEEVSQTLFLLAIS